MDNPLCYPRLRPYTENIMSVMHELKEKNFTDNTLLSNLDFAERFLRDHPLNQFAKLMVKGNFSCVQIGSNSNTLIAITSENKQPCVNLRIHNMFSNQPIRRSNIDASHFFNHSCQDEFKTCYAQAQDAVPDEGLTRLQITCNRFSITYTTQLKGMGTTLETKCQLKLGEVTAEGLLRKKVWLQKEKPTCHGMIACLDHLIKLYLTTPNAKMYCGFIINADKEIIRIHSDDFDHIEYVLLHDHEGVSMFPPTLQ